MPGLTLESEIKLLEQKRELLLDELIELNWLGITNERWVQIREEIDKIFSNIFTLIELKVQNESRI